MTADAYDISISADSRSVSSAPSFYVDALRQLSGSRIPFLVGGAFAFVQYVHMNRDTKDLDLFVRRDDFGATLDFFSTLGYDAHVEFPHWLGKVHRGDHFIDVIFSSGNGVAAVDDLWFAHAIERDVLGVRVAICPPEEIIWSKAFVQERERFDGADVLHLIRELGPELDWPRLLARFGAHWRVLFGHLVMFGFAYPNRRQAVPQWVMDECLRRLQSDARESASTVCNGTLLSREQYLHDVDQGDYIDARLQPVGRMTSEEIARWTAAIEPHK